MRRALPAALAAALLLPAVAEAHGFVGRQDLPIPRWLFFWGAGVVLVASFVMLAVLWSRPKLEAARDRRLASVPQWLEIPAGLVGVALFGMTVYAGLAGSQIIPNNFAPTAVYVMFWVGTPVLSLVFGDVFAAFSPWRAVGRAGGWLIQRLGGETDALEYPRRLGQWPAALGILGFAWVELAWADGDDPSNLAVLAIAYMAVQLVGMSLYGVDPWRRNADGFGVLFGLFARLAPLRWADGAVWGRAPFIGAARFEPVSGTIALLCVAIGSTSFDGFSGGRHWTEWAPELQSAALDIGFNQQTALEAAFTVGLLGAVLLIAAVYGLGVAGMRALTDNHHAGELARAFAHSLLPISLAYVIAHYFSLLAYQGQTIPGFLVDPLDAAPRVDYGVVSANGIWYVQAGALIVGHVAALVLAHDRALVVFSRRRDATLSQVAMLSVMVGFTLLGLWLLSAAAAT